MHRKDITDIHVLNAYVLAKQMNDTIPNMETVWPYDILMKWFPRCRFKVAYRAMERACEHGLINYGVSLRTGWITDKGKALLNAHPI